MIFLLTFYQERAHMYALFILEIVSNGFKGPSWYYLEHKNAQKLWLDF